MERDMDFASIYAQLANLNSQLSQNAGRTPMPSVPTFGSSYGQSYQTQQYPQFSENENVWGYQGHNQSRGNMFSNTCNSNWRGYSDQRWGEPQQVQQSGYWQQDEFYSRPMQPPQPPPHQFQSNSSMPKNYNEILDELISLAQGSQKEEQLPPSEEFYQWPCAPPQPPPQSLQPNSGSSVDKDQIFQLLTSMVQDQQNQDKIMDNLKNQMDEIVESMAQIQDQNEFSNSTFANSKGEVEINEAITLGSDIDELLPQEEDEEDDLGSLDEFLSQTPQVPMSSNLGEEVPSSIHSNPIPPNVIFSCRFLNPKEEVNEKDVVGVLPEAQSESPILDAPEQVPNGVETFKEPCTSRRGIQEDEVAGEYVEHIKEAVHETTKALEVEIEETGQAKTIIINLAKFKVPETFGDVVFVIEFENESKPSSPFLILIFTNNLILMMQAPSLELRPWPEHFKYHRPFSDKSMHLNKEGRPRNHPHPDLHS